MTIAMATCNGARFLDEQLQSFLAQTRLPDELVVADDRSTDETMQILQRFSRTAPFRVRIESNDQRLGLHRNFERALSLASSELLLLSDQDDVWYADKIQTVAEALRHRPDVLALHHDEHIFEQTSGRTLTGTLAQRTAHLGGWDRKLAAGNCTALRREALDLLRPFPTDFFYDEWINWLPELLGARLILDRPLQRWRRHGTNLSGPTVAEQRPSRLRLYRQHASQDPRPGWNDYKRRLTVVGNRIAERAPLVDCLLGVGRAAEGLTRADLELARINRRLSLVELPRLRRWSQAFNLWNGGFYEPFAGWKSALKDAFVP